ncbi:hypothetical protein [Streptomyces sp. I05A-00742]|nr:hypothetical protein [Streptomyces sp. I05A-00742]
MSVMVPVWRTAATSACLGLPLLGARQALNASAAAANSPSLWPRRR